jgi:DNA-binding protein WhiA
MGVSFSGEIKSGIIDHRLNNNQSKFLCLYGILRTLKKCSESEIIFKTKSVKSARLFCELCDLITGETGSVMPPENYAPDNKTDNNAENTAENTLSQDSLYKLVVKSEAARKKLISEFHIECGGVIDRDLIDSFFTADFFAGVFLSVGSITDPARGYHMEFSFPFEKTADDLLRFGDLLPENFRLKKIKRGERTILYTKSAEVISDFLTFIGAPDAALRLMNTEILKNVRNKANRIANCDSANIERTITAGSKQAEDIEFLYKRVGRDNIKPILRIAADLRLENPELTLSELGELFDPPLSRSGVNRRLSQLTELAARERGIFS